MTTTVKSDVPVQVNSQRLLADLIELDDGTLAYLLKTTASGGGGSTAVTIADGADVTEGHLADAIVAAGATGSISAKLRRATQGLEDLKTMIVLATGANIIGATKDAGPSWTDSLGVGGARITSADMSGAAVSITDAPTSGQKVVMTDIVISSDSDLRVDLKEETSGTIFYSFYLAANSTVQYTPRGKFKLATVNKKLQAQTSGAGNISLTPLWHSEA